MSDLLTTLKQVLRDVTLFAEHASGLKLREYQQDVALAISDSVIHDRGHSFVVIFPRQSGKNELQAQIETYLLTIFQSLNQEIVKVSPTWKPQSLNAMRRLERVISRNLFTHANWKKESGYIYKVGTSRIYFLSGATSSNIVGATASLLLECDEAQDISLEKFDKEINPMAASTNATKVFWGTAWTSQTLLAREKRAALEAQKKDGVQRVFELTADQVKTEVPSYGKFVDAEIAKLGRNHPFVKTQFFSEEIDSQSGMFPAERIMLMKGTHQPHIEPHPSVTYAFCLDIGGEEFDQPNLKSEISNLKSHPVSGHDSTALTIFAIDFSTLADDLFRAQTYLAVYRQVWTGASHTTLYSQLKALTDLWQPTRIIIDATGVGEGIASFLAKSYPSAVIPFKFSLKTKSDLAWSFLTVIESGRYKEHTHTPIPSLRLGNLSRGEAEAIPYNLQSLFWTQCQFTHLEILPSPGKMVRWSVPDGTRHPETGEILHDDLVFSAALVALLDQETGLGQAEAAIVEAYDPLREMTF